MGNKQHESRVLKHFSVFPLWILAESINQFLKFPSLHCGYFKLEPYNHERKTLQLLPRKRCSPLVLCILYSNVHPHHLRIEFLAYIALSVLVSEWLLKPKFAVVFLLFILLSIHIHHYIIRCGNTDYNADYISMYFLFSEPIHNPELLPLIDSTSTHPVFPPRGKFLKFWQQNFLWLSQL